MFNLVSGTNETRYIEWHEMCKCKCRLTVVFIITNNVGMMINASANAKNWSIKVYAIKYLFRILVIENVNVINSLILVTI